MSDAHAIEAVTEALVQLISEGTREVESGAKVEARPPQDTPGPSGDPQLNLFLYQVGVDAGLRNEDPAWLRPGEHGDPQLPLVLRYLVTAYVPGGHDITAHRMLGAAMRTLHEHPLLSRDRLRQVPSRSDVSEQSELVRLTWQPLGEKDIHSLWSAFQTSYRLTVAFEAGPVLIDSRRPPRTPVPVLRRGAQDRGPEAFGSVESPFPELAAAVPVDGQAARVGERVILRGANLAKARDIRLAHPLLAAPVTVAAEPVSETEVRLQLTGSYLAGLWSVSVVAVDETVTNEVPLAIGPQITSKMPMTVRRTGSNAVVQLTCRPPVRAGQPVLLVLGSRAIPERRASHATGTKLTFDVPDAPPGTHLARLRVGGVDSRLVDRSGDKPGFDPAQTVTIT
ncbi:DUF4255 domain-containing protein [Amycolatopsis jejuensis]|uniref:DUF4255 domain-containing protein n=1 Tax=Amycolatopsis jejuensis TaxID=330084 RepID=UPI00052643D9|nr:DUF4255 domain-containing protein [Amycolatopsis jejuensis]